MLRAEESVPDDGVNAVQTVPAPRVRSAPVRHVLMTADAVGGVWQYALRLGRAFAERGVRTTVAVMGPAPDVEQQREAARSGVAVVAGTYRLEWMDDPWEDVERAGHWLLSLERRLRPDVVHLNGYSHASLSWRAPVVVVAHSCVRSWWRAVRGQEPPARLDLYREAVTAGLRGARVAVAPTAAIRDAVVAEYGVTLSWHVIPNGCVRSSEPAWHAKENVVLAAGRAWDEAKNIAALCSIADRLPWPVCVAGETRGPAGGPCSLAGVRALGRLSSRELTEWFRRASIYALPARYEPFGLSVLEAACDGCALVLGNIASLKENWSGAAVFVPPDDTDALRSAIADLIARPVRRRELGEAAWHRAAGFTIDRAADEYLRLYRDIVE